MISTTDSEVVVLACNGHGYVTNAHAPCAVNAFFSIAYRLHIVSNSRNWVYNFRKIPKNQQRRIYLIMHAVYNLIKQVSSYVLSLISIVQVLPVSTATVERSFSKMTVIFKRQDFGIVCLKLDSCPVSPRPRRSRIVSPRRSETGVSPWTHLRH